MFNSRAGTFGDMDSLQGGAKQQDEDKRAAIGQRIDSIYQGTKSEVEKILTSLDTAVDQAFTSGADAAKQAAVEYIKRETAAYKAKRYNEDAAWYDIGAHIEGGLTRVGDMFGMPDEYYCGEVVTIGKLGSKISRGSASQGKVYFAGETRQARRLALTSGLR